MNIGEAANASGVSAKMIRYYERVGLVEASARTDAGYRSYGSREVHNLRFVRRARDLGFKVDEIRDLLGLWRDHSRRSADVKRMALNQIELLEQKAQQLQEMADALKSLADCCTGDARPDCPILAGLEEEKAPLPRGPRRRFGITSDRG